MGEQGRAFGSGDRVRVTRDGSIVSGRVVFVRPSGYLLCLMDDDAGVMIVNPSDAELELAATAPLNRKPYLSE